MPGGQSGKSDQRSVVKDRILPTENEYEPVTVPGWVFLKMNHVWTHGEAIVSKQDRAVADGEARLPA